MPRLPPLDRKGFLLELKQQTLDGYVCEEGTNDGKSSRVSPQVLDCGAHKEKSHNRKDWVSSRRKCLISSCV